MKHLLDTLHQKFIKLIDLIDSSLMLIGSYHLAQIKDFLGIIGLGITITYTIWKWRKEYRESKLNK